MNAVAVTHVPFETIGGFGAVLKDAGIHCEHVDAATGDLSPARDAALLVVMGGPISANDVHRFPFLNDELALIEHRVENNKPTIGVCLGAQLIARVMGARVYPMAQKEIGWSSLNLTEAGRQSPLAHLTTPVLHWHGETFDLPAGAESLASTALCPHQAFAAGRHVLALQFHAEVGAQAQERWLVGHISELDQVNANLDELRRDAAEWGERGKANGGRMLQQWLRALEE